MNIPEFNDYCNDINQKSLNINYTKQAKCLCLKCHAPMFKEDNMIICKTVIPPIYVHTLTCEKCGHSEEIEERSGLI